MRLARLLLANGLLGLLLAALYLCVLTLAGWLWVPLPSPLGLVAATVAVALSAAPLQKRVRRLARRVIRSPTPADRPVVHSYTELLNRSVEPEALQTALLDELPGRLGFRRAELWMLEPPHDHSFVALGATPSAPVIAFLVNGTSANTLRTLRGCVEVPDEGEWAAPFRAFGAQIVMPLFNDGVLIGAYACDTGGPLPAGADETLLALRPAIGRALAYVRVYTHMLRLNAQLRELDQLKDKFIESVGHELRTPLTTLSLAIQLLEQQPHDTDVLMDVFANSVVQLQAVVDRVLAFDAYVHDQAATTEDVVDISALLDELIADYAPIAEAKGVQFSLHLQPALEVYGPRSLLRRGLHEILDNAVRYSTGGEVTLTSTLHDGLAVVGIADQGPGIPADERDQLFAAFYRGEGVRALASTPGVGLGLSIARRDIESLNGRVWLAHSGPSGSLMCVALPAVITANERFQERELGA